MTERYVSLHRHDNYSTFDGVDVAERAADWVRRELDQPALGLTNHGNISGLVEHHFACKVRGIKPIHGIELYVVESVERERKNIRHLTLLVENATGYQNLCRLVTKSYQDGNFYYKPRVPLSLLEEHAEGLICLSGCPSSLVQRALQRQDVAEAERLFSWFARVFQGRFYAEFQHHSQELTGAALAGLAERYGVPPVFTNDAHYVEPKDRVVHDLVLKLRRKDKGEDSPSYGEGFHLLSREEAARYMAIAHPGLDQITRDAALENTVAIAERCQFNMDDLKPKTFLPPLWEGSREKLEQLGLEGLGRRGISGSKADAYTARLWEELRVIHKLGYDDYFMVCWEATSWAREQGILVGPRGSVCGSLLAYALGITQVDPLVHGTLFERFLHDQKKSMPDVDLDFDARYRDRVIEWALKRYSPYAIPIVTFGRYGEGNVASDLGEEFQLDEEDRKELRSAIREMHWNRILIATPEQLREFRVIRELERKIPEFVRIVQKLYGAALYLGQHPGGLCFVPGDYTQWLAKIRTKAGEEGSETTCYHMVDVERLGLLKFDFLALTALSVVRETLDNVKVRHGNDIAPEAIPLDDKKALESFAVGKTDGIFQFETSGGRQMLKEVKPSSFKEVAAVNALNRPGVSDNLEDYIRGKQKQSTMTPGKRIPFSETYGAVVYQEDILVLLRGLGFTWPEGDAFLKSIKGVKRFDPNAPIFRKFVDALTKRGVTQERAEAFLKTLTRYSFNKAHATAYSMVSYWQMWLRVHYPVEFWAATIALEKYEDKQRDHERAALRDGCIILTPHVNGSAMTSIEGDAIRLGMASLKNVGLKAAQAIVQVRTEQLGGKFTKAVEVAMVPQRILTSKVVSALRKAGALEFDDEKWMEIALGYNRRLREWVPSGKRGKTKD